MLILNDNKQKINISKISIMLGCSTRTVHRNMTNELRREKELLNQQL
jgi:transcriptional antiterminator